MGNLIKDITDGTSITASAEGITISALIKANTVAVGDILEIDWGYKKTVATANLTARLRINTSASLSGATALATRTTTASIFHGFSGRILHVKASNDTRVVAAPTNNGTLPDLASANAETSVNIDWTVDQYLIVSMAHSSGSANASYSTMLLVRKR